MKAIKHIAGPLVDEVQRCVVCGDVISDYRGAMFSSGTKPNGFPEGEVFKRGNVTATVDFEEGSEPCRP